jgi:ferredoxin
MGSAPLDASGSQARHPAHDPGLAFRVDPTAPAAANGREPLLGGALRQQAVWVDEAVCIGCRYCAHVATNTFVVEPQWGRSRAIRQDGDSTERIQEAIDTCPVDCIHWVAYQELPALEARLAQQEILPLGLPNPARLKRTLPRAQASARSQP